MRMSVEEELGDYEILAMISDEMVAIVTVLYLNESLPNVTSYLIINAQ